MDAWRGRATAGLDGVGVSASTLGELQQRELGLFALQQRPSR
jgi:hypothetical protein